MADRKVLLDPLISIAIEPKTKADQEKLGVALQKVGKRRSETPTLQRA